jgi:hypothetical protein
MCGKSFSGVNVSVALTAVYVPSVPASETCWTVYVATLPPYLNTALKTAATAAIAALLAFSPACSA